MCSLTNIQTNYGMEIAVADIKADFIRNVMESAAKCDHIIKIIIFGSVIEERCRAESDIDLLVISDTIRSRLYKKKSFLNFLNDIHKKDEYTQQYDVICVHGMEEIEKNKARIPLYQEAVLNGKVLYQKG